MSTVRAGAAVILLLVAGIIVAGVHTAVVDAGPGDNGHPTSGNHSTFFGRAV